MGSVLEMKSIFQNVADKKSNMSQTIVDCKMPLTDPNEESLFFIKLLDETIHVKNGGTPNVGYLERVEGALKELIKIKQEEANVEKEMMDNHYMSNLCKGVNSLSIDPNGYLTWFTKE